MKHLFVNLFWSTNHKRIGILYLLFGVFAGFISVLLSLLIRMQLAFPNNSFLGENYQFYNMIVSMHGIIMLFFVIIPISLGGFGNFFVPIMIGAPDMVFPRLNNLSFWLLPPSFSLLLISLFCDSAHFLGHAKISIELLTLSFHLIWLSFFLSSINIIYTLFFYKSKKNYLYFSILYFFILYLLFFMLFIFFFSRQPDLSVMYMTPPSSSINKYQYLINTIKKYPLIHLFGNENEIGTYGALLLKDTHINVSVLPFGQMNMGVNGLKCDAFRMCTIYDMFLEKYEFKNVFKHVNFKTENIHRNIVSKLKHYLDFYDGTVIIDTDNSSSVRDIIQESSLRNHSRLRVISSELIINESSVVNLNQKIDLNMNTIYQHLPPKKANALQQLSVDLLSYDEEDVKNGLSLPHSLKDDLRGRHFNMLSLEEKVFKEILHNYKKQKDLVHLGVSNIVKNFK